MGMDVYVYDHKMKPLASTWIEFVETDQGGTKIDLQTNSQLNLRPTEYGARLKAPNPQRPVSIIVDDRNGQMASTIIGFLNTQKSPRLDVALYPLPVGPAGYGGGFPRGGGPGGSEYEDLPDSLEGITDYVHTKVQNDNWTEFEATGVLKMVEAAMWASTHFYLLDSDLKERRKRWLEQLEELGIQLQAIPVRSKGRGSGTGGAPQEKQPWKIQAEQGKFFEREQSSC